MRRSDIEMDIPDFVHGQFDATFSYIHKRVLNDLEWPDLIEAVLEQHSRADKDLFPYTVTIPIATCYAVGGEVERAIPLAASWVFYYLAAVMFDDIQDRDEKGRPWNDWPPAHAMTVGLGVLFSAQTCLAYLDATPSAKTDVLDSLARNFRLAARGQAHDLKSASVEVYFKRIISNTGLLFAAISRAGARLHTRRRLDLQNMYDYGLALGVLGQIKDDCNDLAGADLASGLYTLPVIYALSQSDHPRHPRLVSLLEDAPSAPSQGELAEIYEILDDMRAMAFSMAIAQVYRDKALAALQPYSQREVEHLRDYATKLFGTTHSG